MTKSERKSTGKFSTKLLLTLDVDEGGNEYYLGTFGNETEGSFIMLKIGKITCASQDVLSAIIDDSIIQEGGNC